MRAAIGRAPDFFGTYDTALTGYAILPAMQGKTVNLMGSSSQPHTFTYIKDFGTLAGSSKGMLIFPSAILTISITVLHSVL